MIRGRHRGLPAAIDRAVMFPAELQMTDDLIRQASNDGSRGAQATSYEASNLPSHPSRYSETTNSNNQVSAVHRRFRTTSR